MMKKVAPFIWTGLWVVVAICVATYSELVNNF